jgi:hypothetical protein
VHQERDSLGSCNLCVMVMLRPWTHWKTLNVHMPGLRRSLLAGSPAGRRSVPVAALGRAGLLRDAL